MTSKSSVLNIATETNEIEDTSTIPKKSKAFFQDDFKEHLQKVLLNRDNPLESEPNDKAIERLAANQLKKNGHHYYEFAPAIKMSGWIIDGPTFEPKGVLRRVKDRISKDHWIADNVTKYKKDSRDFIQKTVSDALDEEQIEIYQYLCYLREHCRTK